MEQLGPGVIGKDQPVADGKQRRARPCPSRFIDFEQRRSEKNIAAGNREQAVHLASRECPLQQEQIDSQSQRIAIGQALVEVHGNAAPIQVGKIVQPQTLPHRGFVIPGAANAGDRLAQGGHIGIVDLEEHWLRHGLRKKS